MDEIKLGDVVYLNSDPRVRMTVQGASTVPDKVVCMWFHDLELRSGKFNKLALTKVVKK